MKTTKVLLYVGHWMPVFYENAVKALLEAGVSKESFRDAGASSTGRKLKGKVYVLGTTSDDIIVEKFAELSRSLKEMENFEVVEVPAGKYRVLTYDGAEFLVPENFMAYGSPASRLERSSHRKSSEVSVGTRYQ